jgi:hypothetical protein
MLSWLRKILHWLWVEALHRKPLPPGGRVQPRVSYKTKVFSDRSIALDAAHRGRVLAVVERAGTQKWVLLRCPCGCGEDLALNLMRSHLPVWELAVNRTGQCMPPRVARISGSGMARSSGASRPDHSQKWILVSLTE